MMEMMKEDIEKEIKMAYKEDGEAQAEFEADRKDITDMIRSNKLAKVTAEKELAAHEQAISDTEGALDQAEEDHKLTEEEGKAIFEECEWVDKEFGDRKDKRKIEIQGLMDAKNKLAGEGISLDDLN